MAPRMRRRGWVAPPARTVSSPISRVSRSEKPRGVTGGRAPASAIRPERSCDMASPPWPPHSRLGHPDASAARASIAWASASARRAAGAGSLMSVSGVRAARRDRTRPDAPARRGASSSFSASRRDRAAQSAGRGPRRPCRSRAASRAASAARLSPRRTRGCFSTPSISTGFRGSAASRATSPASTPTGQADSGAPTEEAATTPQRAG